MKVVLVFCAALAATAVLGAEMTATPEELARMVAEDVAKPVRPIGVNGQEPWNDMAIWFMYPPTIVFPKCQYDVQYRHVVIDAANQVYTWSDGSPSVNLESIWGQMPPGRTEVWNEPGFPKPIGRQQRCFWKMTPFNAETIYPKGKRSFREAERMGYEYMANLPHIKYFAEKGEPLADYELNCYPAKIHSAVISAMVAYGHLVPEKREEALKLARTVADYLISISLPPDSPLANFPPTYWGDKMAAAYRRGQNMLQYPSHAGMAYMRLYDEVKDEKYLEAAIRIADTYMRLQGEDGTWPLMLSEADGSPISNNRLMPPRIIRFLVQIASKTGNAAYLEAADRAFGFLEKGPLTDWNWEGQFEDQPLMPSKYLNHCNWVPLETAMLLLERFPKDERRIAQAREILRFVEEQFICWKAPFEGRMPIYTETPDPWIVETAAVEQFWYRDVIDASVAMSILAFEAMYRATGNPLDLAKARALGNAMTFAQNDEGRIPTAWSMQYQSMPSNDWMNCMEADIRALHALAELE